MPRHTKGTAPPKPPSVAVPPERPLAPTIPVACASLDRGGRIRQLNPAASRLLGLPHPAAGGRAFSDFLAPQSHPGLTALLDRAFSEHAPQRAEFVLSSATGGERRIQVDACASVADNVCLAAVTDITEHCRAEATRRAAEARYRRLFESVGDAFVCIGLDGRIEMSNATYRDLLGYTETELVGLSHRDLTPAEKPGADEHAVREQVLRRGYSDLYETAYRHKGGTVIPVELRLLLVRDESGDPAGLWAIVRDIAQRKHGEQVQDEALRSARAVIAALQDGYALFDRDGFHLDVNEALCRMSGFTRQELIGAGPPSPYWPPECHPELERAFGRIRTGCPGEFEVTFMRKCGERFTAVVSPSVLTDESGNSTAFSCTIKDISDRKRVEEALRRKSRELEHYFNHAEDLFLIADTSGYIHRVNPQWEKTLGYRIDELEGQRFLDLVHPDDLDATLGAVKALSAQESVYDFTNRYRHKDGSYRCIEWTASAPEGTVILAAARDVTARRQTEQVLLQAAAVFENTHDGVMITDDQERIVNVNRAFTALTGYPKAEALGQTPRLLKSGRHDRAFYETMWRTLGASGQWQGEIWNRRKSGEIYPELLNISTIVGRSGKVTGYAAVFSDITHIKAGQEQLEHLAHYDPLTGLINRRLLLARIEHALQTARRSGETAALLLIDLDHFKEVNDRYGHAAGDDLLQQVAQRFLARLRKSDTLARLGGDEFAVMLEPPMTAPIAAFMAHELLNALTGEIPLGPGAYADIGASMGIAIFPDHGRTVNDVLHHADVALYQAKREGRNTFRFFSEELTLEAREQHRMEQRLRLALRNDELTLHYQPQIHIPSGRVIGVEALVRWVDPVEGLIMPERFIALSEETRLIVPLGDWVLRTACTQMQAWAQEGLPRIRLAVNLSALQVARAETAGRVLDILTETGFSPQALELELAEQPFGDNQMDEIDLFVRIHNLGVTLALDDFGTGYSSLSRLHRYPVSTLKIDRCFIAGLTHDAAAIRITRAIIGLAHTLGFRTVAEGVETQAQLDFLSAHGCDAWQGYLASPPLPANEFAERYLRRA